MTIPKDLQGAYVEAKMGYNALPGEVVAYIERIAKSEADYKALQEDLDAALEYRQKESEKWNQMQDELEKQLEALQERVAQQESEIKRLSADLEDGEWPSEVHGKWEQRTHFHRIIAARKKLTDQQLQPAQVEQG